MAPSRSSSGIVTTSCGCSASRQSSTASAAPAPRAVDRDRRPLAVLQERECVERGDRCHALRCGHEDELIGAPGGEPRQRADQAGAEIEDHDVVEAGQQRDGLAVLVRPRPFLVEIAAGREHVQAAGQPRDIRTQLGSRQQAIGIGEQVGQSPLRPAGIGDELGEAAEAGIGIHGDGAQLQVGGEQVGDRNAHVVFPTPPLGLISATTFARVTPGWVSRWRSSSASSCSARVTSSRCPRRRRRASVPRRAGRPSTSAAGPFVIAA